MMKNARNLITVVLMVVVLLMTSCGEDVDPNLADVQLKIKATSNLGGFDAGARTLEEHITFNQVLLVLPRLNLNQLLTIIRMMIQMIIAEAITVDMMMILMMIVVTIILTIHSMIQI